MDDRETDGVTERRIRAGDVGIRLKQRDETIGAHGFEAWRDFIAGWRVDGLARIKLTVENVGTCVALRAALRSRDVKDPTRWTWFGVLVPVPTSHPTPVSPRWVRALLRWLIAHDLDEWIEVDGKRPFDPHRGSVPCTPEFP